MDILETVDIICPYCGESLSILIDGSVDQQTYIEDCQVCCRPIMLSVSVCDGLPQVEVRRENE